MKTPLLRRLWVLFFAFAVGFYAEGINRLRVEGGENIPSQGGTLLASNHISGYETVFIPYAILKHRPLQMIWAPAKEELFRNPLLGWLFRSWGAFPVKRGRDTRAGKKLEDLLRTEKVMLFPEGTRHRDGTLGRGNRGVGKLIYEARPQVVPVALAGLNSWRFPGFGQRARIAFGRPLDLSDLYAREESKETHVLIMERVMGAIQHLLDEMGADIRIDPASGPTTPTDRGRKRHG